MLFRVIVLCVLPGARQDGSRGTARLQAEMLQIDYVRDSGQIDRRATAIGIYDVGWIWQPEAGQRQEFSYAFSSQPPLPQENTAWLSEVLVTGTTPQTLRVSYSFQGLRRSNLFGCSYSMPPVEARFVGEGLDITSRWSYFPELGLGLKVRVTDNQSGESRGLTLTTQTAR